MGEDKRGGEKKREEQRKYIIIINEKENYIKLQRKMDLQCSGNSSGNSGSGGGDREWVLLGK